MMKRCILTAVLNGLLLATLVGCARYTPSPVNPDNKEDFTLSKYEAFVFEEEPVRLRVCLALRSVEDTTFESAYLHALRKHLEAHDVDIVQNAKEADVSLDVYVKQSQVTPAPRCRMKQQITMAVKNAKGEAITVPWTYECIMPEGVADPDEAKRQVWNATIDALSEWFRINFHSRTVTNRSWSSSLLRLKTRRDLVHFRVEGEKVATGMLVDLKSIPGMVDVTLVEKDTDAMVFSFRVFYNRQNLRQPLHDSLVKICKKYN